MLVETLAGATAAGPQAGGMAELTRAAAMVKATPAEATVATPEAGISETVETGKVESRLA